MLEGLAQTGGILVGEANGYREKVVLAKIPKARFAREALAGEQLTYAVEMLQLRPEGAIVAGKVLAGAEQIGEAEIYFAHLDQARSQQMFGDHNFVFSGELKHVLGLAKAAAKTSGPSPA
jgi:3-hydroxyacyl-[acyl-carrier-protein] dehydratase